MYIFVNVVYFQDNWIFLLVIWVFVGLKFVSFLGFVLFLVCVVCLCV